MSVFLKRSGTLLALTVEPLASLDGQGKPTYGEAVEIEGRAIQEVKVERAPDGTETMTVAEAWIDADQSALPYENDRVTLVSAGLAGIVVEYEEARSLRGNVLDHVHVVLRKE